MGNRILASRVISVLLALLFLVGLGVTLYPFVSDWYYQTHADELIHSYEEAVDQGMDKGYNEAFHAAESYNTTLVGETVPDVFAIREGTHDPEYESQLNVLGNLMMGTIEIPAIDVNLPIYHYSDEESLEKGCGHIFGSSLPVGGTSTHAVITAHRGLASAKLFAELDQVKEGDRFFLQVLDRTLAYEVDHIEVVDPAETRSLAIQRGSDYVTLVTCTPYGINTERLLVRGHRVPFEEGDKEVAGNVGVRFERVRWILIQIGVAILGVFSAALLIWWINGGRPADVVRKVTRRLRGHDGSS